MEKLEISNFLTIRQATVDVRRFTIFIGPQANGKSVIAKVLYFFRNFLTNHYVRSVENQETKIQLEKKASIIFEQIFPRYTWNDQEFQLTYKTDDIEINISKQYQTGKRNNIKIELSKNLTELHRKAKKHFQRKLEEAKSEREGRLFRPQEAFWDTLIQCIYGSKIGHNFENSVFIPASRSFFANLQKNVFSFLANNIDLDPLIKEFGSVYESSKANYDRRYLRSRSEEKELMVLQDEIKQEFERIITGHYVYEDDQDWIVSGKRRINLANAASGQQEVLPLLLVLSNWLNRTVRQSRGTMFFIEEPEAHLFPVSQRRLIGIFSRFYATFNCSFVLTTHSPYILTAFNNLILASNIAQEGDKKNIGKVQEIIGQDQAIKFEDISAYTIQDGLLKSILDPENNLIGSSIIDSVSDEFDKVFDKLLGLSLN
jgi:predicted ATPase